jgi:hypothetical protein
VEWWSEVEVQDEDRRKSRGHNEPNEGKINEQQNLNRDGEQKIQQGRTRGGRYTGCHEMRVDGMLQFVCERGGV